MKTETARRFQVRPIGDQIVVIRHEGEDKSPGGIVLPEQAKEKPCRGCVSAVGSGHISNGQRIPLEVKMGDEVYFAKYAGNEIEVEDHKFVVIREQDVLAVVKTVGE
jgi:chaperonin GroES